MVTAITYKHNFRDLLSNGARRCGKLWIQVHFYLTVARGSWSRDTVVTVSGILRKKVWEIWLQKIIGIVVNWTGIWVKIQNKWMGICVKIYLYEWEFVLFLQNRSFRSGGGHIWCDTRKFKRQCFEVCIIKRKRRHTFRTGTWFVAGYAFFLHGQYSVSRK